MPLLSVRCNHCGAPIEVGESTRFVTCQFCSSQLQVTQTESSVFTEVVQQIVDQNVAVMKNLRVIEIQNELERLDREWLEERDLRSIQGKDGHKLRPTVLGSVIGFLIATVIAVFALGRAIIEEKPTSTLIFGGSVAFLIGLFSAYLMYSANQFNTAESDYLDQRDYLLHELIKARQER